MAQTYGQQITTATVEGLVFDELEVRCTKRFDRGLKEQDSRITGDFGP